MVFVKFLWTSYVLFSCLYLCIPTTQSQILFASLGVICKSRHCTRFLSNIPHHLETYFILFPSSSGVVSGKRGQYPFPVCYKLKSVRFLKLTNVFLLLLLRVFTFFKILSIIAYFVGSFCFLLKYHAIDRSNKKNAS